MPDDRFVMEEIARGPRGPQGPQGPKGADGTVSFDELTPEQRASLNELGISGASVGDLVRVAAVDTNGKPTSWQKAPLCDIATNPNLLDNWYFVGGGSQQGGGQFPVNQRGLTNYMSDGYGIDRWKSVSGSANMTVSQAYCTFGSNSSVAYYDQLIASNILGKTITYSVLTDTGLHKTSGTVPDSPPSSGYTTIASITTLPNSDLFSCFIRANGDIVARIGIAGGKSLNIIAVKLELGSEQTLAHQENGQWVLNEIPDYGQELAKCQRYLIAFKTSSNTRSLLAIGIALSATQYRAALPTPVTMKHQINRTVELTGTLTAGALTASSVSSFWEENPGSITLFVNVTGATIGDVAMIMLGSGSTLTISAEL